MPRNKFLMVMGLILTLTLLLAGCGTPTTAPPSGQTPAAGGETPQPPSGGQLPTGAADLQTRISDSFNRTMGLTEAGYVLGSFHLEITATEPSFEPYKNDQIVTKNWTMSADLSGDDVHFIYTTDGETTEGYIIDGGTQNADQGGKACVVTDGKVEEDTFGLSEITWTLTPLTVAFSLAVAATGPTAQGTENFEGRVAEKYVVDSANAPADAIGGQDLVGGFLEINSSRGTVWVDQQTGAMLRAILDYRAKIHHPVLPTTVVGTGNGHVEVLVSQIGQVTVTLPQ